MAGQDDDGLILCMFVENFERSVALKVFIQYLIFFVPTGADNMSCNISFWFVEKCVKLLHGNPNCIKDE